MTSFTITTKRILKFGCLNAWEIISDRIFLIKKSDDAGQNFETIFLTNIIYTFSSSSSAILNSKRRRLLWRVSSPLKFSWGNFSQGRFLIAFPWGNQIIVGQIFAASRAWTCTSMDFNPTNLTPHIHFIYIYTPYLYICLFASSRELAHHFSLWIINSATFIYYSSRGWFYYYYYFEWGGAFQIESIESLTYVFGLTSIRAIFI